MPVIYVHGVNTRDPRHFDAVNGYLRRIVAPAISTKPEDVSITSADWFQLCDPPKFGGIARPRTLLAGHGASSGASLDLLLERLLEKASESGMASTGSLTAGRLTKRTARLETLTDDELADLLAIAALPARANTLERVEIGIAADKIAREPAVRYALKEAKTLDAQLKLLATALRRAGAETTDLVAAGAFDVLAGLKERIDEALARVVDAPGSVLTVAASEFRPALNDFVTRFLGDVLFYMTLRGTSDAPGPIPLVLIDALRAANASKARQDGEPIVLLTHSMGGQVAYDTITSFLPAVAKDIKVDFWCATASQVGFFEELSMFLASSRVYSSVSGKRVPFPSTHLGQWWNIWDQNDILSFTTEGIFEGNVDDEDFWSGMAVAAAHGGYLARPSFYRRFFDKLTEAFPGRGVT